MRKCNVLLATFALCLLSTQLSAQEKPISLNFKNVKLEQVLGSIEKQTNYLFVYGDNVDVNQTVSIAVDNKPLRQALGELLPGIGLQYTINNTSIALSPVTKSEAAATNRSITGKVVREEGTPVAGATVVVKGTTTGTMTANDGTFSLNIPSASRTTVLAVNFLGYESKEVQLGTESYFSIMLRESTVSMDQVVVTALGITREKRAVTYNVQEIKNDDMGVKDANVMTSLAGKVAGATINASASGIGGGARVVLRGVKSINASNTPLYVIDGIPMTDQSAAQPDDNYTGAGQSGDGISMINSDDIETISVLSGAAASALYGSMAANGVVMITTKKGKAGTTNVTFNNSSTFYSPFVMPKFQNRYGSEAGEWYSWSPKMSTPTSYDAKDFFQTGYNVANTVSLTTGTDRSQTYVSAATMNARGIVENNDVDRYNVTFRNTVKFLRDRMTLDLNFMYSRVEEQNMLAQGEYANPLVPIYLFPRGDDITKYQYYERYDPNQEIKTQFWPLGDNGLSMQNPWWITNRNMYNNNKDRYLAGASLSYKITDWLNVAGRLNLDNTESVYERKMYASTLRVLAENSAKGAYLRREQNTKQFYGDVMLNFNKDFCHKTWSLSGSLGASFQDVKHTEYFFGGGLNAIKNLFTYGNVNSSGKLTYTQDNYHDRNNVVFGLATVGYKSMVYLDGTLRAEWHSALAGSVKNHLLYPSVGASFILTDILGIHSRALNFAKLRLSYSEVGNSPRRFATIATWPVEQGQQSSSTVYPLYNLTPELTQAWEAGLNVTLFNNKLTVGATAYKSKTTNQLFDLPISVSQSAFNRMYVNGGQVSNKGIELTANYKQHITRPLVWSSTAVWSLNRNKIDNLLHEYYSEALDTSVTVDYVDAYTLGGVKERLYEGGSMGDLYVNSMRLDEKGYIWINSMTGAIETRKNNWIYAGNSNPSYNLSWRNDFNWKGLSAGCMVSARVGGVGVSGTQAVLDYYGVSERSAAARDAGGIYVNEGSKLDAQTFFQTVGANGVDFVGAMYVYDMTNVRLSEVTLGYDFPVAKWTSWLKTLNVSLVGRNLLMFYCKAPFDPESTASTATYNQGIDYFMQPSMRSVGFSVKVGF